MTHRRIEQARNSLRAGGGIRLEDVETELAEPSSERTGVTVENDDRPTVRGSSTRTVADQVYAFGSRQSRSGESRPRRFSERAAADIEFIDENGGGPGVRFRKPPKQKQ